MIKRLIRITVSHPPSAPLFSFGLISDIQYADINPASNFGGGEHREYRASVSAAEEVVAHWSAGERPLSFIAQLGDLIDGQNAGGYGQGLEMDTPQSEEAVERVLSIWDQCPTPVYHAVGNHELYNFTWEGLRARFNQRRGVCKHQIATDEFYFSFSPSPGWRVVFLNSYEENVICPTSEESFARVDQLLREMNPNYGKQAPFNFFEGLSRERYRFVPFNGGFGARQLSWLEAELTEAQARGERALIASHLPIFGDAASVRNVAFDADEALEITARFAPHVALYMAGHRHGGGYAQHASGVHHLTVQAPLTHGVCGATVEVYEGRLMIHGLGAHKSHHLELP